MKRISMLFAAFAALLAMPAAAQQDTTRCATVTVSRAAEADIPALIADAECYAKAMQSAANSQALRLAKARELAQGKPAADTALQPDDREGHGGHAGQHAGHGGHAMPAPPVFKPLTVAHIRPIDTPAADLPPLRAEPVPISARPDVVGAFRATCNMSHLSYDDPIAYPRQPGAAHLHHFFGNTLTDAHSTYESLRTSGESTCQGDLHNRSAYWIPALLNGEGSVVMPDYISLYYKRRPDGDPKCATEARQCGGIPPGLQAIFGTNYILNHLQSRHVKFDCEGKSGGPTLTVPAAACKEGERLYARVAAPDCWNGRDLDSPDHQSHLAYRTRDRNSGQPLCPRTHPVIIPELTLTVAYPVHAGDDPKRWIFSSDQVAGTEAGETFHADYMEAWHPASRLSWEAACIGKLLNCSDGDLGDGRKMPRPKGFTFAQKPHLIPAPGVGETVHLPRQ